MYFKSNEIKGVVPTRAKTRRVYLIVEAAPLKLTSNVGTSEVIRPQCNSSLGASRRANPLAQAVHLWFVEMSEYGYLILIWTGFD